MTTVFEQILLNDSRRPLSSIEPVRAWIGQPHRVSFVGIEHSPELVKCYERDESPLPPPEDRENYGGPRHLTYWLAGLRDAMYYLQTARRHGLALATGSRSFELGCSTGRVLRHLRFQGDHGELWGADINIRNIRWMQRFLPPDLRVFNNHWLPHLPIEDNFFDLIHSVSVFTHTDHFEMPWLLELRRILKPGGLMIHSLHTDVTWAMMGDETLREEIPLYNALIRRGNEIEEATITPETFKSPMPADRVVFTYKGRTMYHCNSFHTHEYLRREWGKWFIVEEIVPRGVDPHDAIVLRKPCK